MDNSNIKIDYPKNSEYEIEYHGQEKIMVIHLPTNITLTYIVTPNKITDRVKLLLCSGQPSENWTADVFLSWEDPMPMISELGAIWDSYRGDKVYQRKHSVVYVNGEGGWYSFEKGFWTYDIVEMTGYMAFLLQDVIEFADAQNLEDFIFKMEIGKEILGQSDDPDFPYQDPKFYPDLK